MSNYRSNDIPSALSNQLGWMPYTLKHNPDTKKLEKKPVLRGWADSTDSLELCLWKSRNNPSWRPGLSLNPEVNGIALIDFDNVGIGEGNFTAEAMGYVNKAQTLSEVSASGNGIHLLITAKIDKNYKHKYLLSQAGTCELYWEKRFAALTFDFRLGITETLENYDSIPKILPFVYEVGRTTKDSLDGTGDTVGYGDTPKYPIAKSTFEGLRYYLNKAKNHEKFSKLYNGAFIHDGQWLGNESYPTQSEADLALCCLSMFYTKSKHFQEKYIENLDQYDGRGLAFSICDKLMRRSQLNRKKWKRFDYRLATLNLAYELQTSYYFDEHFRSEFSALQRANQLRSAHKRAHNNQSKILDAINLLSERGDRISQVAIINETKLNKRTVSDNLRRLEIKVGSGKANYSKKCS